MHISRIHQLQAQRNPADVTGSCGVLPKESSRGHVVTWPPVLTLPSRTGTGL